MKIRASGAFGTVLLVGLAVGQTLTDASIYSGADLAIHRIQSSDPAFGAEVDANPPTKSDFYDALKSLEGGLASAEDMTQEMDFFAGRTDQAISLGDKRLEKRQFELKMIVSHHLNLETGLNIMSLHSLSAQDITEDLVTMYNHKINEAEEHAVRGNIAFSRAISIRHGQIKRDLSVRKQYLWRLKEQPFHGSFEMRAPEAMPEFIEVRDGSFDPLDLLTGDVGTFEEVGDRQHTLRLGDADFIVTVTPRLTDLGTFSVEVNVQQDGSLVTQTFVLVYE